MSRKPIGSYSLNDFISVFNIACKIGKESAIEKRRETNQYPNLKHTDWTSHFKTGIIITGVDGRTRVGRFLRTLEEANIEGLSFTSWRSGGRLRHSIGMSRTMDLHGTDSRPVQIAAYEAAWAKLQDYLGVDGYVKYDAMLDWAWAR